MRTIEPILESYGDLIFDLCQSILGEAEHAQVIFRQILKSIKNNREVDGYEQHQRALILKLALKKIKTFALAHRRPLPPAEQIRLDAEPNVSVRLQEFDTYFRRLGVEDQVLLLFRDKYKLSFPEIATAMGIPEGTLKTRRQQALRTLEEWLWDHP